MSIENKVPMSDFTEVTDIADTARIIGLQDNENVKIPLQSLIAKTLSRVDEDILKKQDINVEGGVTGFNPIGEVKQGDSRAVSGDEVLNKVYSKEETNDLITGGSVNVNAKFDLTEGTYINRQGVRVASVPYSSTNYVDLMDCEKIIYKGRFGESDTSVAFFDANNVFLESLPSENEVIENITITRKSEWKKARFTTLTTYGLSVQLTNVVTFDKNIVNQLQSFRFYGVPTYENDQIKTSNIVWNNGRLGSVTYSDWSDSQFTFTSFKATCIIGAEIYQVEQPKVIFKDNGEISQYPNFIITKIQ